jgi:hypothetical protein
MILERFDRKTLTKMEIALERACAVVSTGNQKHRSRRYIAKRIIGCASGGDRDLESLTAAAIAAAEELNASRSNRTRSATSRAAYPGDKLPRLDVDGSPLPDSIAHRHARVRALPHRAKGASSGTKVTKPCFAV